MSEPALIATLLGDALKSQPEPDPTQVDLLELGELVIQELVARLKDEDKRADIPGTALLQLSREVIRTIDAERERKQREHDKPAEATILEILHDAALPVTRKRKLLRAEISRVENYAAELRELVELLEEK